MMVCFSQSLIPHSVAETPSPAPGCDETEVVCLIRKYWDGDDTEALSVARCESGYDPHAQTGSHYGIFQLSREYHEGRAEGTHGQDGVPYTWDDMWDAGKNTAVAYSLWKDSGWGPWTCRP